MRVVKPNQSNNITLTINNRNKLKTKWAKLSQIKAHTTVISVKCSKMHATKSRLVSVLRLTGWVSVSFFNQSESKVKQNQSKHNITFDTHLKTALCIKATVDLFDPWWVLHEPFSL